MTVEASRGTVAYTGRIVDGSPQVSRLDAAGGVTVTRPDQSARGNYAVYDLNRRVIAMIGGVTLTQGGNTVNGGRLTITLDTGRAVIDGAAMAGGHPGAAGAQIGRAHGCTPVHHGRPLCRPPLGKKKNVERRLGVKNRDTAQTSSHLHSARCSTSN